MSAQLVTNGSRVDRMSLSMGLGLSGPERWGLDKGLAIRLARYRVKASWAATDRTYRMCARSEHQIGGTTSLSS